MTPHIITNPGSGLDHDLAKVVISALERFITNEVLYPT